MKKRSWRRRFRSAWWHWHGWSVRLRHRIQAGFTTLPDRTAYQVMGVILVSYALVMIPIGLGAGFLRWQPVLALETGLKVGLSSLFWPGMVEELIFRLLWIPHPTEPLRPLTRRNLILSSLICFWVYHLGLGQLDVFKLFMTQGPFLLGAALLGLGCTFSYLQSRSIWTAILIHWLIVVQWLLVWGGLEKISVPLSS